MIRVIDASAAAALLFGEPDADSVAARLGKGTLTAPSLLRYELASVYIKKIRRYPRLTEQLRGALRLYRRLGIDEVQVPMEGMAQLAGAVGLSVYDAAYLWLARHLTAPLITLDRRLIRAANELGVSDASRGV